MSQNVDLRKIQCAVVIHDILWILSYSSVPGLLKDIYSSPKSIIFEIAKIYIYSSTPKIFRLRRAKNRVFDVFEAKNPPPPQAEIFLRVYASEYIPKHYF